MEMSCDCGAVPTSLYDVTYLCPSRTRSPMALPVPSTTIVCLCTICLVSQGPKSLGKRHSKVVLLYAQPFRTSIRWTDLMRASVSPVAFSQSTESVWYPRGRGVRRRGISKVRGVRFFQCSSVRVSTQFVARDTQPGAEILSRRAAGSRHRASHHLFNQGAACLSV
jgi:hypothetical protein